MRCRRSRCRWGSPMRDTLRLKWKTKSPHCFLPCHIGLLAAEQRVSASFLWLSASFFLLSASLFLSYLCLFFTRFPGTCHNSSGSVGYLHVVFLLLSASFSGCLLQSYLAKLLRILHLLLGLRDWQPTSPLWVKGLATNISF